MRVWSEPYDASRHPNRMNWGWDAPSSPRLKDHLRAPTLLPHNVVFVNVCGFTFEFHSCEQALAYLEYYQQKVLPSSRLPYNISDYGDHWEAQRWFDSLPLRLREESKRQRVVRALEACVERWDKLAGGP